MTGGCDFCGPSGHAAAVFPTAPVHWEPVHNPLLARTIPADWTACADCTSLIGDGNWTQLADRTVRNYLVAHPEHRPFENLIRAENRRLHQAFSAARTGDPEPLDRVLVVGPDIPDDAPPDIREGLARRALVNTGQSCPCGARLQLPSRAERRRAQRAGQVLHIAVEHDHDCPATDEQLIPALRAWKETRR